MSGGSNRLPVLAEEIAYAHRYIRTAATLTTLKAIECGQLLLEAKASCAHGEWLPWLKEHCGLSERTAQGYMRLARRFGHQSEGNAQRVADIALRAALALVAKSRSPEDSLLRAADRIRRAAPILDDAGMSVRANAARAVADVAESLAAHSERAATLDELKELAEYAGLAVELFGEWQATMTAGGAA